MQIVDEISHDASFRGAGDEAIQNTNFLGIDFVSLAKREEEIFLPRTSEPIILPKNSSALFLFQRIRDEAHRFAVTYHKKLRSESMIKKSKS